MKKIILTILIILLFIKPLQVQAYEKPDPSKKIKQIRATTSEIPITIVEYTDGTCLISNFLTPQSETEKKKLNFVNDYAIITSDEKTPKIYVPLNLSQERLRQILLTADRFYASSKICSVCGHKKKDLKLSDRIYHCEKCGTVIDRDYNASVNLYKYGKSIVNH